MARFRVAVTDSVFPNLDAAARVLASVGAEIELARDTSPEGILAVARNADAVLVTYAKITAAVIGELSRCRIISRFGIGVDNVDLAAASEAGIVVTKVPDYCIDEVSDHAMALMLALARKVPSSNARVHAGEWSMPSVVPIHRLRGRILGLVGFGRIPQLLAPKARAFGIHVIASDPFVPAAAMAAAGVESVTFDDLVKRSDFVSIHAPLTADTRHLFNADVFRRMKPTAFLVNTARGPLVDEDALVEALEAGSIAGAALDVLEREPPPPGSPLLACRNLILTPHTAFYSEESLVDLQVRAAEEVARVLRGEHPRNPVIGVRPQQQLETKDMAQEPWKTDNWFVSPWNFAPEVRAGLAFADKIQIHDVTLRDGEQQTGIIFTKEDKIRIAEALAAAGVHRIEAGMPVVSPSDQAAIKEIVKRNLGPKIYAFSRCMVDDVKRAVDCGVTGVVMEVPSSEHILKYAYKWPLEKAIDLSIESTAFAHSQGLEVVFFPIDFTRAEIGWVLDLITRVANEGHMDALALVDTFGVTSPHAMRYFVRQVKSRIDKRLEAHFHMDFGMGVANTIMALAEGVEVMHTTVLGIGERAGNTPMEETVVGLLTMYGVDTGIDCRKLYDVAHLVAKLAGQPILTNRPVVGDALFQIESGIIASWFQNCGAANPTELFPYRWDLVGQQPGQIVFGKGSGIDSIKGGLRDLGVPFTEEEALKVLAAVKQYSLERKRLLTPAEFRQVATEALQSQAASPA